MKSVVAIPNRISEIFKEMDKIRDYNSRITESVPNKIFREIQWWAEDLCKANNKLATFDILYMNDILNGESYYIPGGNGIRSNELTVIRFDNEQRIENVIFLSGDINSIYEGLDYPPKRIHPFYLIEDKKLTVYCKTEYELSIPCGDNNLMFLSKDLKEVISVLRRYKRHECVKKIKDAQKYYYYMENIYPHIAKKLEPPRRNSRTF